MNPVKSFENECKVAIEKIGKDTDFHELSNQWLQSSAKHRYSYNFKWLGRPIIQYPQDIVAIQEIIWETKPDLIIETGIAHGGSLIFSASMLELLGGNGQVLGIDIDIRSHNRDEIEKHPMFKRITMLEGSSTDKDIVKQVIEHAKNKKSVMVILDSMHSHDHVLEELQLYSPLVSKGNYLVVLDTVIEFLPPELFPDRPWSPGDNPFTAVHEFMQKNNRFVIDRHIVDKLQITVAPDGFLRCVSD
jgi:cephalosporin hydroxylase